MLESFMKATNTPTGAFVFGGIMIVIAVALHFWRERREFYRTGSGGVQEYEGYGSLWKSRIIEFIVGMVALGSLLTGLLFIAAGLSVMYPQ